MNIEWKTAQCLPEREIGERFDVYLAFSTKDVKLASWSAWIETGSEYHSNGTYLGQFEQDSDTLYMTDDGFDVRKDVNGWHTVSVGDDGVETRVDVVAWTEALIPCPEHPSANTGEEQ
ncbi:MAG: hypothetical protein ACR2P5_03285 [Gammaproteobacteria bacterium]